jgi:hypothetical protein
MNKLNKGGGCLLHQVRNGHGLTLGSDCSGGARNITWRHIYLNGNGPTCTVDGLHTCGNGAVCQHTSFLRGFSTQTYPLIL